MPPLSPASILYVDPNRGQDSGSGGLDQPSRTITWALRQAQAGDTIQLATGRYSAATGEQFPLQVPPGVAIAGDEVNWGATISIEGGGLYQSAGFVPQNVTLVLGAGAQLQGVTLTNGAPNGTGIWVETGAATIAHNTLTQCSREGIFVSGHASPIIADNRFLENQRSGISIVRHGKGEIHRNRFEQTGYGIAIGEQGAPLVTDNVITGNRVGVLVWGAARPVLRRNRIEANQGEGLIVVDTAIVDLGHPQDPGYNRIRENGSVDVHNATANPLLSVGNDLVPFSLKGPVELVASDIAAAIPALPTDLPGKAPPVGGDPPAPTPGDRPLQFQDLVGHWAATFITKLVDLGLIRGFLDGTFRPDIQVTRAQYAAIILAAFPLPPRQNPVPFRDVPANFWAAEAIRQSTALGFLSGYPDGTFRPDSPLTRVQALVALVNGLGWVGGNPNTLGIYRDRAQIPSYAIPAIATATQRQMVVNYPRFDELNPMRSITRSEMAALVYQALVAAGRAPAIASPYIVRPDTTGPLFPDIAGHWATDFIYGLAHQDVMGGFVDGQFRPNAAMTRAQYATLIVNAFNPPPVRPATTFGDVPADFWAASSIQSAYRAGFLSGFPNRTFAPAQVVSRAQVLVSLVNGLSWGAGDETVLRIYADQAEIPAFARGAIAKATEQEIVINEPDLTRLRSLQAATRAEVAAMVYQARVALRRSPPLESPYIVRLPTPITPAPAEKSAAAIDDPSPLITPLTAPHSRPPEPVVVMLDPGHGGTDPGAIGPDGLQEKDIVLDIAQQAAQYLNLQDIRTILTRSADVTLDLATRVEQAQTAQATLFISLHSNAISLQRPEINGLETYHEPGDRISAQLATHLHQQVLAQVPLRDRGVRPANFYLLREVGIPAVLMELGFVTGAEDAPRLADPTFREQLAQAIAAGIVHYVEYVELERS